MEKEQHLGPQGIWANDRKISRSEDDAINGDDDDNGEDWGDFKRKGEVGIVYADDSGEDDEEGKDKLEGIDPIKLREYELNKLRYYFAIAEFDSISTAESIYQELDDVEFEHSSMVFDLRFVPDDVR